MSDTRFGNFHSCCRLCLSDKQDGLKSVFDCSAEVPALPQKILQFCTVEITNNDRLSTMVCNDCIAKVSNWDRYNQECVENQTKLEQWMNIGVSNDLANMSIQIKEEPVAYNDELISDTIPNANEPISIKLEPMDELYNDLPPPLTPQGIEDLNMSEDSQSSTIATESSDGNIDKKKCTMCDKTFASVGNRKKHEKQIHGKQKGSGSFSSSDVCRRFQMNEITSTSDATSNKSVISGLVSQDEASQNSLDSEDSSMTSVANPQQPQEPDQQKIQFAAGLKLFQRDSTPISCEQLSKIEYSYIEKCKAMVNMHKTLECACHGVQHPNLKGLLSHLRALRIWFPVFTCYNCMISFSDRSTFTKHHGKCQKTQLEALTQLSNLKKRSEIKTRLYQNYKCTACKFMYSFHDEFCRHVDEEHAVEDCSYTCTCQRTFTSKEDYRDHAYVSCLVEYYCDICFVTVKTIDHFQRHAQEVHDSSEGFILLQDDNYKVRKSLTKESSPEETLIVTGKRERRQSVKAPVQLFIEQTITPTKVLNPSVLKEVKNSRAPTKCPVCQREYSNYHNMLRHYKSHLENQSPAPKINVINMEPTIPVVEDSSLDNSLYACPDCGGMYTTLDWINHLQTAHESKSCAECGKVFQFQTELDQHRSVHLNLKVYRDSKTQSYKTTMLSPNSEEECLVMCELCDTMFPNKEELREHKLTHDLESTPPTMPTLEPVVAEEVRESKYHCTPCNKTYLSYGGLWDHNKKKHSDEKKMSEFPKKCDYCDKVCMTGASLFSHKQMHERMTLGDFQPKNKPSPKTKKLTELKDPEESYHTCNRCFKVFSSRSNLKMHMRSHSSAQSPKKAVKKVWCDICHTACDSNEALEEHKQEHETDQNLEDMPDLTDETNEDTKTMNVLFTCDVCVLTFTSKAALKKHKEKHDEQSRIAKPNKNQIVCKYCRIAFNGVMELTKHMHEEHNESAKPKITKDKTGKSFKCSICQKPFASLGAMNAHFGWHKRNRPNSSKISTKVAVVAAVDIPKPIVKTPEFQCGVCSLELPNHTALQIHVLEKHRNVDAVMLIPRCDMCNQDFESQEEYETHKRYHDFLERQQKHDTNNVQLLQVTPSGGMQSQKKNFPCSYCKSVFSRGDTLTAHVKQHHKEFVQTEFKCTQCDRMFDKQNSLTIHLKVHDKHKSNSGGKPLFSCSICNMGFNLPKDLRMHTINAHPF